MLVASLLFAVQAAFVKVAGTQVGALEFVGYRGLFGILLIGIWAYATGRPIRTNYLFSHFNRGFLGTTGMWMWLYTVAFLPLGTSMTLNNTSPLFMSLIVLGLCFVKSEKIEWGLILATFIGFAGVVMILQPEFREGDLMPALIALGSGLMSALAYFQVKQLSVLKEPAWKVVFYFSIFNAVFGFGGHLLFEPPSVYNSTTLLCIVGTGLTASLAQVCMTQAYGAGNLLLSALLQFSGIIFACLIGWLFFGDALGLTTYIGIVIIICAGATASIITKRKPANKAAAG